MASKSFIDLSGLTHYDEKLNEKLDAKYVALTGDQTISGTKTFSSELQISSTNAIRMKNGKYGAFFRNDSSAFYLLVTAENDPNGSWTTARPFTVNLANGICSINGNAATATTLAVARKINGVSFNGSADITIADSTKVAKAGDTMTGTLGVRCSNVDLSTTSTSTRESWTYLITRNASDTTHSGNLMRLGVAQPANTQDYSLQIAVANPRGGNIPNAESIAAGTDDADASTGNCWGGIGVYYDYSKNRVFPVTQGTTAYGTDDNHTTHLATTAWVRTALGNFACNAATATKASQDSNGREIAAGYMWRGSYERIEGTSSAKKDLNDYKQAGFYNVKTLNTNNCPSGIGIDAVLLNYPWNQGSYLTQEITESAASADCRRWIRKLNGSTWSAWKEVAMDVGAITTSQIDTLFA